MPHGWVAPGKVHERLPLHVPAHRVGSGALPPSGMTNPPSIGIGLPPSSVPSVCDGSGFAWHSFSGSLPAAIAVQVPPVPESAHDSQVPLHAVSQHTPSAQ